MFQQRLKHLLCGGALLTGIVVFRLIDLQIVRAEYYRDRAEDVLLRPAKTLPFARGRILDRCGRVLAADEPCWEISVQFDRLKDDLSDVPQNSADADLWTLLSSFSHEPLDVLHQRRMEIVNKVRRWAGVVSDRFGYEVPIREQKIAHPIVTGLDDQAQISARLRFDQHPDVSIDHGSRRIYDPHPSLGHLLGHLGSVSDDDLANDTLHDDPLASYTVTDSKGIAGIEYAAEHTLRGRRGRLRSNRQGDVVEHTPAVNGQDVSLTLHIGLQDALYKMLDREVHQGPFSTGAALVVLHVPTREVLALVSYPGFDANQLRARYDDLRRDTKHTPLRFRALANTYEPGSIVKPLTCIAALAGGLITTTDTFHCNGYYLPNVRDRLRCWQISGTQQRKAHASVNVSAALAGSCNVFMYHLGDLLGVDALTGYFDMAGFGRSTGIGLLEERSGINPTADWLMTHRNAPATAGRAKNFAIGQGELSITPLQAANLMAVYASGDWRPISIVRDSAPRETWKLPVDADSWLAVRDGLFRVTNDPIGGTAYHTAHWTNGRYTLCGKTGSATTPPSPTHYRVDYFDADGQAASRVVPAKVRSHAIEEFQRLYPQAILDERANVRVEAYWPPNPDDSDERYAHAWFAGYLQPVDSYGRALHDQPPPIAFALVVEFGGSGGFTAGPIAKDVAAIICDHLGESLDPDQDVKVDR